MSATPQQLELLDTRPDAQVSPREIEWLMGLLSGQDWLMAQQILENNNLPTTETAKRRLRKIASCSGGRIAGDQRGYKLVLHMTADEFGHADRWMARQEATNPNRVANAQPGTQNQEAKATT